MYRKSLRLWYTFRCLKPETLPVCNSRVIRYFCTEEKFDLKPEDTFGSMVFNEEWKHFENYKNDYLTNPEVDTVETIRKMKKLVDACDFEGAKELMANYQKSKRPPPFLYRLLIASAASLGKVEEAFHLYNDLKKRNVHESGGMYTSLFYACANCPRSDVALPIANKLLHYMFNHKKLKPNVSNFNAMLMAYSRHGDFSTVMLLIDKIENVIERIPTKTYNFVLDGCISQRNTGLRFAIIIWHHMVKKGIRPDKYTFQALGRCVRDCSLGDSDLNDQFLTSIFKLKFSANITKIYGDKLDSGEFVINPKKESQHFVCQTNKLNELQEASSSDRSVVNSTVSASNVLDIEDVKELNKISNTVNKSQTNADNVTNLSSEANTFEYNQSLLPNVLTLKPPNNSVLKYGDLSTPENRLLLFGGLDGFLSVMDKYRIKPDIVMFSLLLECIPSTKNAEEALLEKMKEFNVRVDTIFLNILIKRIIARKEEKTPQDLINMVTSFKCRPDLVTIGTIATGCVTHESGKECIELARSYKIRLNNVILGALLEKAEIAENTNYVSDILAAAKENHVVLDARFVCSLQNFLKLENKKTKALSS